MGRAWLVVAGLLAAFAAVGGCRPKKPPAGPPPATQPAAPIDEALASTLAALRHPDRQVRHAALQYLRSKPDSRAVGAVVLVLGDPDEQNRYLARDLLEKTDYRWRQSAEVGPAIVELVGRLSDGDQGRAAGAARALAVIGDPRATDGLLAALAAPTTPGTVRAQVLRALNTCRPGWTQTDAAHSAVPLICGDLARLSDSDRDEAVKVLVKIGDRQAVEPIIQQLPSSLVSPSEPRNLVNCLSVLDPDWRKSPAAGQAAMKILETVGSGPGRGSRWHIEVLGEIGSREAVPGLIGLITDEGMCSAALSALNRLDPNWGQTVAAREAVPRLIAALDSRSFSLRFSAISALGAIGDKRAAKPLIDKLADQSLAEATRKALDKIEPNWSAGVRREDRLAPLTTQLEDASAQRRREAVEALARLGDRQAIAPLVKALKDPALVQPALEALGRIDSQWTRSAPAGEIVPLLIEAMGAGDSVARTRAVESLARFNDPRVVPALVGRLGDAHIGRAVIEQLDRLDPKWPQRPEARTRVDALLAGLQSKDEYVRRGAIVAIGRLDDPRAIEPLMSAAGDFRVAKESFDALDRLEPNWRARLGQGPTAPDPLTELLGTLDKDVVTLPHPMVVDLIARLGDPRAVDPLIQRLADRPVVIRALDSLDKSWRKRPSVGPVVDRLIGRMKSEPDRAWNLVQTLRDVGDPRAVGPLLGMLPRRDSYGRQYVAAALDRMDPNWRQHPDVPATVDRLVETVHTAKDSMEVENACNWLRQIGDKRAVEPLARMGAEGRWSLPVVQTLSALEPKWVERDELAGPLLSYAENAIASRDTAAVLGAVALLKFIGTEEIIPPLARALGGPASEAAVQGLGNWPTTTQPSETWKAQYPHLVRALTCQVSSVRQFAVRRLAWLQDRRAVEPLVRTLDDRDSLVREAALAALDNLDAQWTATLPAREMLAVLIGSLGRLGELPGGSRDSRLKAIQRIDPKWNIHPAAGELVPHLLSVLRVDTGMGRDNAIYILGLLQDKRAVEPLEQLLHAGAHPASVISALVSIEPGWSKSPGGRRAVEKYCAVLRNTLPGEDRGTAIRILEMLGDPAAAEVLYKVLSDRTFCAMALKALEVVQPGWWKTPAGAKAVPDLLAALGAGSGGSQSAIIKTLVDIGDRRAVGPLIDQLVGRGTTSPVVGMPFVQVKPGPSVVEALDTLDPDWRKSEPAREEAGRIREQLEGALAPAVAGATQLATWDGRGQRGRFDPVAGARLLGLLDGTEAFDLLERLSRSGSEQLRQAAAAGLGTLNDKRAIQPLLDVLVSPGESARVEAWRALERMSLNWPASPAARQMLPAMVNALLSSRSPTGDWHLVGAVRKIDPGWLSRPEARKSIEQLIGELSSTDASVQNIALFRLRSLTRQELGRNPAAWKQWWQSQQAGQPTTGPTTAPGNADL